MTELCWLPPPPPSEVRHALYDFQIRPWPPPLGGPGRGPLVFWRYIDIMEMDDQENIGRSPGLQMGDTIVSKKSLERLRSAAANGRNPEIDWPRKGWCCRVGNIINQIDVFWIPKFAINLFLIQDIKIHLRRYMTGFPWGNKFLKFSHIGSLS